MADKVLRTICDIASEFAPPGTKKIANGVCKNLTGSSRSTSSDKSGITCVTETGWLGGQKTTCSTNKPKEK